MTTSVLPREAVFPFTLAALLLLLSSTISTVADEIPIATLDHPEQVDFQNEILPILRKKCLACHNETDAEGELVLESPQTIAKGGSSGETVVPGDPNASLMLQLAAHREEPMMPPEDNASGASPMTPEELALLSLWIQQGAQGEVSAGVDLIQWQALPQGVRPIFAAAQTNDGRYVAAGRANQVWIYDLMLGNYVDQLIDSNLADSPVAKDGGITHLDFVQALAFDANRQWVATGGFRTVKLWKSTARDHEALPSDMTAIHTAAAGGDRIYLASSSGEVQAFEQGNRVEVEFPQSENLDVAPNGSLATVRDSTTVQLVSPAGETIGQTTAANALVLFRWLDDNRLAAGSGNGSIYLWQFNDSQLSEATELKGHTKPVTALVALGANLISGADDGEIRVWNLESGETEKQFSHGAPVTQLAAAGDRFISTGGQIPAKVWSLDTDQEVLQLAGQPHLTWEVTQKTLAQQVAKRHLDNTNQDLEAAKKRVEEEEANLKKTIEARDKAIEELKKATEADEKAKAELEPIENQKVEADEKLKAAEKARDEAGDDDAKKAAEKAVEEAAAAVKKLEEELKGKKEAADKAAGELKNKTQTLDSSKRSVETSEKASAAAKERAEALNPVLKTVQAGLKQADESLKTATDAVEAHPYFATRVATAPSGLIAATTNAAGIVQIYRTDTGRAFDQFDAMDQCKFIHFPSNHTVQVVTKAGKIVRWQLAAHWQLVTVIGSVDGVSPFADRVTALAFSPDGAQLAVGGGEPSRGGQLQVFDVEKGSLVREIEDAHSDTVFGIAFSPNGKQLASCGADRFMKVFDVESGEHQRTFEGHTHHVLSVDWRADGRVLATGGADKVVKIWNTLDGSQLKTIQGFGKEVAALQFAGTTDDFFTACGDHNLYRCNVGGDRTSIGKGSDFLYAVSANAVGEKIAFAGHDSVLRIVDREGKQVTELKPSR